MKRTGISTSQLAKICGVSQGTVDRALNNRKGINTATKEKILAAAKEYGYKPNIHARNIAGGSSMLIGIVVFDLNNQYFSDIITAIERECAARDYSIIVMFSNKDSQKELECINNLYSISVDGIVLCPINSGTEYENYLTSLGIPIVTIGNKIGNIPYVGIDNYDAMCDTVQYLLAGGYSRLIYVMPLLNQSNAFAQLERKNAFCDECAKNGLDFTVADITRVADLILPDSKTAVVCAADIYALRLFGTAKKAGAGIIGFDNIRFIDELNFPLDSVAYDIPQAAESLVNYIIGGKKITAPIKHKIITRGSVSR